MSCIPLEIDWEEAYSLYEKGLSFQSISIKYSCSRKCIERNLKKRFITRTKKEAAQLNLGVKHHNWKEEGALLERGIHNGYLGHIYIKVKNKFVKRSHYNWCIENSLLYVPKNMVIHHINLDKHDDKVENLIILDISTHHKLHSMIKNTTT